MKVRILHSALEDLSNGRRFYERRSSAVGAYFFDSLFSEIDSLVLYAGIHGIHLGHHRLLARRFPFAIYYKVIADEAVVSRVLDCRRDPSWIRKALDGPG
jgi:plasmid stabilization system protein ParE